MRKAKSISIFCRDISRTSENRTWICMVSSNQSRRTGIHLGRSLQSWPRIRLWTWTLLERHNWSTYHLSSFRKWTWFGKINNILIFSFFFSVKLVDIFFTSKMNEKKSSIQLFKSKTQCSMYVFFSNEMEK